MKTLWIVLLCTLTYEARGQTYKDDSKPRGAGFRRRPLPFSGNGTCEEPKTSDGFTTVRCLGPEIPMLPGQTIDTYILLESPYPSDKNVTVIKQEAQMVAKVGKNSWREVPLSELYFHHVVPNPRFLLGEGAEVRGSRLRQPLQHPHAFIVDGKQAADPSIRQTNLQLVNIIGVPPDHVQKSIECWCGHEELGEVSERGSLFCCKQSPTTSLAGIVNYQLEYNVTFRDVAPEETGVNFLAFDATGGSLEYNIATPSGPDTTQTMAIETEVDKSCPQSKPFEIVRCTAHQHVGSKCMHMRNLDTDELICSSCPIYGNHTDVPGNELGYVVAIQDADPGYMIKPGTRIRVESVYHSSQKRLGVMGIMGIWVSGLAEQCGRDTSETPMSLMNKMHAENAITAT